MDGWDGEETMVEGGFVGGTTDGYWLTSLLEGEEARKTVSNLVFLRLELLKFHFYTEKNRIICIAGPREQEAKNKKSSNALFGGRFTWNDRFFTTLPNIYYIDILWKISNLFPQPADI